MVHFTDRAITAIGESMIRSGLDLNEYALNLCTHEGNLSIIFKKDISESEKIGDVFVKVDKFVQSHHIDVPLTIDFVTNGEKSGIIFLEGEKK